MYWRRLSRAQRIGGASVAAAGLIGLLLAGGGGDETWDDEVTTLEAADDDAEHADAGLAVLESPDATQTPSRLSFQPWSHASGLFKTEVPRGWRIEGALGDAMDQGQFRINLSPQFFELWNRAFAHTQQQMREYSAQMDRVFSRYLQSVARSSSRSGRDTAEDWATMMRGGQYAENEETGEHYWITNDRQRWWVNDRGTVVGTDTGEPPAVNENWKVLTPRGQNIR